MNIKKHFYFLPFLFLQTIFAYGQTPQISSFSPSFGKAGSTVVIYGSNFSSTISNNAVFFGPLRAVITLASTDSLRVTVPSISTEQKITVINLTTGLSFTSNLKYKVIFDYGGFVFEPRDTLQYYYYLKPPSTGDINGDGKTDVLAGYGGEVRLFQNASAEYLFSFPVRVNLSVNTPEAIVCADINGDSKTDVLVTNLNDNKVAVFRNTTTNVSTPSFATVFEITGVGNASKLGVSDINLDGKPDIIVCGGTSMKFFRNTTSSPGSISFASPQTLSFFSGVSFFKSGDLNNDGKEDIVTARGYIIRNTTTPLATSFTFSVDSIGALTGYDYNMMDIGDMDGDGKIDLAVIRRATSVDIGTPLLYLNNTTSSLISFSTSPYQLPFPTGSSVRQTFIKIAGIDGDSMPDVLITDPGLAVIRVYKNNSYLSNPNFTVSTNLFSPDPSGVDVEDLDGDKRPDVIATNYNVNTISIIRNTVLPPVIKTFTPQNGRAGDTMVVTGINFGKTISDNLVQIGSTRTAPFYAKKDTIMLVIPAGTSIANINVTNTETKLVGISRMFFTPTYTGSYNGFAIREDVPVGGIPFSATAMDLNDDKKVDICVANSSGNLITVFENIDNVGKIKFDKKTFSAASNPQFVSFGDYKGNGTKDIVFSNRSAGSISVLQNNSPSGNQISLGSKIDIHSVSQPIFSVLVDLDLDGKQDLAWRSMGYGSVICHKNKSLLNQPKFTSLYGCPVFDNTVEIRGCAFADFNGDSLVDILAVLPQLNKLRTALNLSQPGNFGFLTSASLFYTTGNTPTSLAVTDIDGDGKTDAIVTNKGSNTVSVFRNISVTDSIKFASKIDFATGSNPVFVTVGDIDGDGKTDLIVADSGSTTGFAITYLKNTSSVGNISFASKVDYATKNTPRYLWVGDISNDGKPDILVTNSDSSVSIFRSKYTQPPVIVSQPATDTVCPKIQANFVVDVLYAQSYTWQVNTGSGFTNLSNNSDYYGTNTATLSVNTNLSMQGYAFRCVVLGDTGMVVSDTAFLYFYPKPTVAFSTNNYTQCLTGNLFQFTDSSWITAGSYTRKWYFGDSDSSTAINPSKVFLSAGVFVVTLVCRSNFGCIDSLSKTTSVYPMPQAGFSKSNNQCLKGNIFSFSDTSSISSGSLTRLWFLGEGDSSTLISPVKSYAASNLYSVKLVSRSNYGCSDSLTKQVTVYPQTAVGFSVNDSQQCLGGNLFTFANNSVLSSGTFTSNWLFGDSTLSFSTNATKTFSYPGPYSITLVTTTNQNCKDSLIKSVVVYPKAYSNFSVNDTDQCKSGNLFLLSNASTLSNGTFTSLWNLGTNDTSTQFSPSKSFTSSGTYVIKLTTTTNNGCNDSTIKSIIVYPQTAAGFAINDSDQCLAGNNFTFTNSSNVSSGTFTNLWNFGNNDTSSQGNPSKSFSSEGTFAIKLVTTTNNGCKDSLSKSITVFPQTLVAFTVNDSGQCKTGNNFVFANNSSVSSGTFTNLWNFGNNDTSSQGNPMKSFTTAGSYHAKLVTTTNYGCKDSLAKTLVVYPQTTVAFSVSDSEQCQTGNNFAFTNSSNVSSGTFTNVWNFGDNTTDSSQSPSKSYNNAGTFSVKLITATNNGCKDTLVKLVQVFVQPSASFTTDSTQCFNGNNFVMTNTSSGSPTAYHWDFGNSSTSTAVTPSVNYSFIGTFPIRLVAMNSFGCFDTIVHSVRVKTNPPTPFVSYSPDTIVCDNISIVLKTNSIDTKSWLKNASPLGVSADSIVVNNIPGSYSLTVTNNENCDAISATLNLFFKSTPAKPVVSVSGNVFTSSAATGNQWYNTSGVIAGQTAQTYLATTPGQYYTIVTLNACPSPASDMVNFPATGVASLSQNNGISVYPNPNNGSFTIEFNKKAIGDVEVKMFDVTGRMVLNKIKSVNDLNIQTSNLSNGTYLVLVKANDQLYRIKVLINQ